MHADGPGMVAIWLRAPIVGQVFAKLPSLGLLRLVAALLLATIGMQASSGGHTLERERGSAFSPTTYDVAIAPSKQVEIARQVVLPTPLLGLVPAPCIGSIASLPAIPAPRPDSTGPPAPMILAQGPAPRAPPRV